MGRECELDPNLEAVPEEVIDQYLAEELRLIEQLGHFDWNDVEGVDPDISVRLSYAQVEILIDYGLIEDPYLSSDDDEDFIREWMM